MRPAHAALTVLVMATARHWTRKATMTVTVTQCGPQAVTLALFYSSTRLKPLWLPSTKSGCQTASHGARDEQRWAASVSERKIWTFPLVLPARLCGAAAGNRAHRYIGKIFFFGKVCCLSLVRADYIWRAPWRGPEDTGNCSSCYVLHINVMLAYLAYNCIFVLHIFAYFHIGGIVVGRLIHYFIHDWSFNPSFDPLWFASSNWTSEYLFEIFD